MILVYNPQITSSDRKAFGRRGNEQEQHPGGQNLAERHQEGFRCHERGIFQVDDLKWFGQRRSK